jgi:FAD/FMN-containing dehydrogenase
VSPCPQTYDEVIALVRSAKARGAKLRVMGMVHSWSNLLPDNYTEVGRCHQGDRGDDDSHQG